MKYTNPIILSDYSDPDVIRYKDNFYLVASSFNHTPILPILKSKNLVNWKILRYAKEELPFEKYNDVYHGEGVWAPAIRYHDGMFYIIVPYPDQGIYIYRTNDIENGEFEVNKLIEAKGIIDPCPIWDNGKCYLVCGFAKSRIGFNSCLGMYEVSNDLKEVKSDYKIIFDGHNTQPTIEGPKIYKKNDYYYILAPAGSVKTGWQVALRSKNIYGPYEEKIVLSQQDSPINGPHQGALVDLLDGKDVFIHFQDLKAYGRVCHLEPVKWVNDWPLIGEVRDELIAGSPVLSHDYFIDIKSNYKIESSDNFKNKLSLMWQTPANKTKEFYKFDNGLVLYNMKVSEYIYNRLNLYPFSLLTKLLYESFTIKAKAKLNLVNESDITGLMYMGMEYAYIAVERLNNKNYLVIKKGSFNNEDITIYKEEYNECDIVFNLKYIKPDIYKLGVNGKYFKEKYYAKAGRWIGGKIGIFSMGLEDGGYTTYSSFETRVIKNERK